jgi:hypothetical protein
VVFPEGELLNYLSGRRNPLRNKLYIRGYLNEDNEDEILRELSKARPRAIVIGRRRTGEYGASRFGTDYAVRIGRWIASNSVPGARPTRNQSTFEFRVKHVAAR